MFRSTSAGAFAPDGQAALLTSLSPPLTASLAARTPPLPCPTGLGTPLETLASTTVPLASPSAPRSGQGQMRSSLLRRMSTCDVASLSPVPTLAARGGGDDGSGVGGGSGGGGGGRDGGGHPALPSQGSAPQFGVLCLTGGSLQLRQTPPPPWTSSTLQATAAPAAALSSHVLSPLPSPLPWPTAASATSVATAALPGHSYQAAFGEPLNVAASHDCVTLFFW